MFSIALFCFSILPALVRCSKGCMLLFSFYMFNFVYFYLFTTLADNKNNVMLVQGLLAQSSDKINNQSFSFFLSYLKGSERPIKYVLSINSRITRTIQCSMIGEMGLVFLTLVISNRIEKIFNCHSTVTLCRALRQRIINRS